MPDNTDKNHQGVVGEAQPSAAYADSLGDYVDTVAAVHLLKEVVEHGASITIGAAKKIVSLENAKKDPKIGGVVRQILQQAGAQTDDQIWITDPVTGKKSLEAAITIGGAVYTARFVDDGKDPTNNTNYTVEITSKLAQEEKQVKGEQVKVKRGKLFFDFGHTATVKLVVDAEGELNAVTKNGLSVNANSFTPYPYQNESLAKYCESLRQGNKQRLAIMGTGSGKSIIMAAVAQAVGRCIMVVPDYQLVQQQTKEVKGLLREGVVNGKKIEPKIFTFDELIGKFDYLREKFQVDKTKVVNPDRDNPKSIDKPLTPDQIEEVRAYCERVFNGTPPVEYDQIVLQAGHPLFNVVVDKISNSMVLMDESHISTFDEIGVKNLEKIRDTNAVLALTATPTSKLYEIFDGDPVDELSLGMAIELGCIRPIRPEVAYLEAEDLVDQAVINYFNDYYLSPGVHGYTDPVVLKQQIMQSTGASEKLATERAIEQALLKNRVRAQRNMSFSDDPDTRKKIAEIYQKIAEGDLPTIEKYKDKIAMLRQHAEVDERTAMELRFIENPSSHVKEHTRAKVEKRVKLRDVDLVNDIGRAQQKDVDRTINSYALALILKEKPDKISEADRTNQLETKLAKYDELIGSLAKGKSIDDAMRQKFASCSSKTRATIQQELDGMDSPIRDLPASQRAIMKYLIVNKAFSLARAIHNKKLISSIITKPVNLALLELTRSYAGVFDAKSSDKDLTTAKARIELGLSTHIVSDKTLATGFSCKGILNTQIINVYTEKVEDDINVVNGALSGPQSAGRPVRSTDVEARVQQYIDKRYQGLHLITTIDDIIDPVSAPRIRKVMIAREAERKNSASDDLEDTINQHESVVKLNSAISKQEKLLSERQNLLAIYTKKLHHAETVLAAVPGDELGPTPPALHHNKDKAYQWNLRKMLPNAIKKIEAECEVIKNNLTALNNTSHKVYRRASISLSFPERQITGLGGQFSEMKSATSKIKKRGKKEKKENAVVPKGYQFP